jgi:sugar/nucleoside kinase (ribokinase family)
MAVRAVRGGGLQERTLDVVVAGDLFVDLIMSGFPSWPLPGTESFAAAFQRDLGGGAAITACGLARLGSRTGVMSVVGNDHGQWVAERLNSFGVITSQLRFDPVEPTAVSVAITTPEDRTFLTYHGANRSFPGALAAAAASGELTHTRHVHLGCAPDLSHAAALLQAIQANGCTVSLDTGWHRDWLADPRAMELLRFTGIFFPNEVEARRMTGETTPGRILRAFEAAGAGRVALKLGAAGAALLWDGEILRVEPCSVTPVDTIGAGDSFDAGFLHYWLHGASPLTCLRAGNFCGAASTEGYGGLSAFPDIDRIQRHIT